MNGRFKVLVTDDDPQVLLLTSSVLRRAGHEVLEAGTGGECLEAMHTHHPDLFLLDVMLPDMQGSAVCRLIKADPEYQGTLITLVSGI